MGKKSRAVPGRRPILQLSPPGPRSSTPGRDPEPDPDPEPDATAAPSVAVVAAASASTTSAAAVPAAASASAPEVLPSEEGERGAGRKEQLEPRACGLGAAEGLEGKEVDPVAAEGKGREVKAEW